jgi:hypothetical protein
MIAIFWFSMSQMYKILTYAAKIIIKKIRWREIATSRHLINYCQKAEATTSTSPLPTERRVRA